jgi:hypothetical protein
LPMQKRGARQGKIEVNNFPGDPAGVMPLGGGVLCKPPTRQKAVRLGLFPGFYLRSET